MKFWMLKEKLKAFLVHSQRQSSYLMDLMGKNKFPKKFQIGPMKIKLS